MDQYCACHKTLMNYWQTKHQSRGYQGFVSDGIISPAKWFSLSPEKERILFLLKEAYSKERTDDGRIPDWDEAMWLSHQKCWDGCTKGCSSCSITGSTFNAVAEWIYAITQANATDEIVYDNWLGATNHKITEYNRTRDDLLSRTAIVNIKKSNGVHQSNSKELHEYALNDRNLLREQIMLIKPSVIICGGTYSMLRCVIPELPELSDKYCGTVKWNGIKIIASYHPNSRNARRKTKFDSIVRNYLSLKNQ